MEMGVKTWLKCGNVKKYEKQSASERYEELK